MFKCPTCDYECLKITKMNAHKKGHARQEISVEPTSETVENNDIENTPLSNKRCNREMSISLDVAENGRKVSISGKKKK